MDYLNSIKSRFENIIQGSLWKEKRQKVTVTDGTVLPLCIYFDDLETGNAMGSHAGKRSVGVVDAWIPCEPPSEASKLTSIMLTLLFLSKHRKIHGYQAAFSPLLTELETLRKDAIFLDVDGKSQKVYFTTL